MNTSSTFSQLHNKTSHHLIQNPVDMKRAAAIILGGGQGTRLFPLTMWRCKPAMCFGGRYRLIDVPISNSINSGCHKIYVITQYLSTSLHQHIFKTYRSDVFSSGFIELLPAEEKHQNKSWFLGTADAVRQNIDYFIEAPVDYFFILSGDQLYNMDFQKMLYFAKDSDADLVIAALPIEEYDTGRMGILQIDEKSFITNFVEKPQEKKVLKKFRLTKKQIESLDLDPEKNLQFLGSMGIYLFKRQVLLDLLQKDTREDFGKHLIPSQVEKGKTAAYIHQGYWEDIGTIESFYNANIALTNPRPYFNCYDESRPIFSNHTNLPGAMITDTHIKNSIICEGALVEAKEISHSILGRRSIVHKGTVIRDSYVMGNNYYTPPIDSSRLPKHFYIGENCIINKAIIDMHVCIGKNVQLINKDGLKYYDGEDVYIRDGIIVVSRGATIPDGFIL